MAFENLIIRESRKIGGIAIDGVIEETTTRKMRITDYPLETGDSVADHIVREPMTYQLNGIITDTPMGMEGVKETISGVVDGISGKHGSSEEHSYTRSQRVYNELVKLMEDRKIIKVQTTMQTYSNLLFESITVVQDKDSARAVSFTATFKEAVLVVSSDKTISSENIDDEEDKRIYASSEDKGRMPVRDASETESASIGVSLQ